MVQLRYFSSLRESLGVGEEQLELPDDIHTVGELTAWLQQRDTTWQQALSAAQLKTAVNHEIVPADTRLANGDEIAWFPPVTGG
jgi:molybdopterin synthase sulfur carrier subunit